MKCFETIRVENGKIFNIKFHNFRFNLTREKLFNLKNRLNLENFITPPKDNMLYRCKVIYSKEENIESIEYFNYKIKEFKTFKIKTINFNYKYKFINREDIDSLKLDNFDDIIMVKNGFITDSSIANIAIFYNNSWLTPKTPLLYGVTRERLLREKKLKEANLKIEDLLKAEKFAIMNAMIDFKELNSWKIYR